MVYGCDDISAKEWHELKHFVLAACYGAVLPKLSLPITQHPIATLVRQGRIEDAGQALVPIDPKRWFLALAKS